jgi:hypothetical protein
MMRMPSRVVAVANAITSTSHEHAMSRHRHCLCRDGEACHARARQRGMRGSRDEGAPSP